MTKPLRIALVGTGTIADQHYAAMQRFAGTSVVGLYNPNARSSSLLKRQKEWQLPVYTSYDALLGDPAVDALAILSPTACHAEQALLAARAGKHVLIEKPIALKSEEIDALALAEKEYGVCLMPAHNFVYRPVVRRAKEIIDRGELGNLSYASFRTVHFISGQLLAGWRSSHGQAGGGAMIDSGMHLAYQSLHLMGPPQWLTAFTARRHLQIDDEDVCQVAMQYAEGTLGYLFQSWAAHWDETNEIRIHGDKQSLCIRDALYVGGDKVEDDASYESSFYHLAMAFYAYVTRGETPVSSLRDAKAALQLVQSAYHAARSRQVLQFPSVG